MQGGCMARNQLLPAIAMLLAIVNGNAQTSSIVDLQPAPSAGVAPNYAFPDGRQQFHNYLYNTFGPPGLISTAIGAGLEQSKPAPPEWDSGAEGYAERYGSRFGMSLIGETTKYSLGAVMSE